MKQEHRKKNLNQLESIDWGKSPIDTVTANELHEARRVPLEDLNHRQLYSLVLHKIGLEYLFDKAWRVLEQNPMTEAKYYSGDLLLAVAEAPVECWNALRIDAFRSMIQGLDLSELDHEGRERLRGWRAPPDQPLKTAEAHHHEMLAFYRRLAFNDNPGLESKRRKRRDGR